MSNISGLLVLESLIKRSIQFKKRLKECRLSDVPEGVEVFCYKGEIYDREKFVLLTMRDAQDLKYSDVKKTIKNAKKELDKDDEAAELIATELSAYLRVLSEMKKPLFYVDDGPY